MGQSIDTNVQPRTFLVDVDTEQTEARAVATETRRFANVNAVPGVEAADPQPPVLDSNVLAVAYIHLNTAGIVSITLLKQIGCSQYAKFRTELKSLRTGAGAPGHVLTCWTPLLPVFKIE
ncbi:hypothetical protein HGG76_05785 [Ochrobactrum tritici]|uniref:Uncharacterized protein n=1 Tax=Brucella tritici TaxID=94626 RepID=A0A7X6FP86_9HYPH|nr:hypothetical protein [Brucella tritici]